MKQIKRLLLVYRAPRFSPNAQEKDKAILDAVPVLLEEWESVGIDEEKLWESLPALEDASFDAVVTMARSEEALGVLEGLQRRGIPVLNSPASVRRCDRRSVEQALLSLGLETPETLAEKHPEARGRGFWVKKSDTTDSSAGHVFFSETPVEESPQILVQPHLLGECVKFYGVGDVFFHACSENPLAEAIRPAAFRLAEKLGLDIYGGDAILTQSGLFAIIDFNDFPSFSACRAEAAGAIANALQAHLNQ